MPQITPFKRQTKGIVDTSQVLAKRGTVRIFKFVYRSNGHRVIGFLADPGGARPLPCIIWNRGGTKDFGLITPKTFYTLTKLARWGYLVIASQYSGCGGSEGKDEMGGQDLKGVLNLYRALGQHPHADTERIGMVGWSRGGLMTYLALTKARWVRAAVSVAGIADVAQWETERRDIARRLRTMFAHTPRALRERSAIKQANRMSLRTPLLLLHGTADWRVSPLQTLRLAEQLYNHRIPFRLALLEGGDHALKELRSEEDRLTREWLDRFVKNREKTPNLRPHGQ